MKLYRHWSKKKKKKKKKWKLDISNNRVKIPRSIPTKLKSVTAIDIHVLGGATIPGCCAAAYAVVHQPSSISQD